MGKLGYWKVSVSTAVGATSYEIPNVQNVSFSYGRTQPTDDVSAATGSISGILPEALPALAKEIGSVLILDLMDPYGTVRFARFWLEIKNLSRTYGTTPNLDTWTISAVGWINKMTEQQITADYTTTAGRGAVLEAKTLLDTYGITNAISNDGESLVSGTTFTKGTFVSDIVQTLIRTEQGRISDCVVGSLTLYSRSNAVPDVGVTTTYSDNPGFYDGTYTAIEFVNDGDYLANTVLIEPDGLSTVSIGTTRPALNFNTLDQTTTQATGLAEYIKQTLNLNTVRPYSITYIWDAQSNGYFYPNKPGAEIAVVLRGVTYKCIVEGASVSASPSATQVTLQLSSAEAYRFLRLDAETFGTLDYNRLGF